MISIEMEITISTGRLTRTIELRVTDHSTEVSKGLITFERRDIGGEKWQGGDDLFSLLSWEQEKELMEEVNRA